MPKIEYETSQKQEAILLGMGQLEAEIYNLETQNDPLECEEDIEDEDITPDWENDPQEVPETLGKRRLIPAGKEPQKEHQQSSELNRRTHSANT